jgi:LysR family transcriptional regulator, regulator for bpeEF and oprC
MVDDIDLFRGVVPFVTVAEEKSFRRAAIRLGVSPAAISKSVQTLEAALRMVLLTRSARSVALTREGEAFFERAQAAVAAMRGARELVDSARKQPEGPLTVSVPFVVTPLVAGALALLHARLSGLWFRVRVTDQLSKLGEESVDVAVRVGVLSDSRLVARPLRATRLLTVAAPGYLARKGAPKRLEDLERHDCVSLVAPNGKPRPWVFRSGPLGVRSVLQVDHGPMLVDVVRAGLGIGQAFDFMIDNEEGLIRVLEDETAKGPDIYAVCAPGRRATPRVRAAFDAFAEAFAQKSG